MGGNHRRGELKMVKSGLVFQ